MTLPSLSAGAAALVRTSSDAHKDEWPYPWEYPPPNAELFNKETSTAAPLNNVLTELLLFTVPDGYFLRVAGIMLAIAGSGFTYTDGSGDYTWIWDVNTPTNVGAGITAPILPSGQVVPYFDAVTIHKGSPDDGWWRIPGRLVFEPRDDVRVKVTTQAPFPETGVNFLVSLIGWTWPVT